jgi:hypothetical protein
VTVKPVNGFNSAVTLECSGLPSGVTCSFNPATVTPTSSGAATSTLTIAASTAASNTAPGRNPFLPGATLAVAGCLLFWKKRHAAWCTGVLLLSTGLFAMSACGGGGAISNPPPPPPTTASVTITASSGALQQTATIALTIKH